MKCLLYTSSDWLKKGETNERNQKDQTNLDQHGRLYIPRRFARLGLH